MRVEVKKKKNSSTEKLLKSLNNLTNSSVEIGHWQSQGKHSGSKLSYVDLLNIWEKGVANGNEGVIMNPRMVFIIKSIKDKKLSMNKEVQSALSLWFKNSIKEVSPAKLLDKVGESLLSQYKDVFGHKHPLMQSSSPSNTTPFLDTHETAMKAGYKTSSNPNIKGSS